MKTITKILVLSLCLVMCFTSCTFFKKVGQEAKRVEKFAGDFVQLVENPTIEKAEEIVHPNSPLTPEAVIDEIKNNEKFAGLDVTPDKVELKSVSDIKFSAEDKALGGNIYSVDCELVVDGTPIIVSLELLSSDAGFGLYNFDIK